MQRVLGVWRVPFSGTVGFSINYKRTLRKNKVQQPGPTTFLPDSSGEKHTHTRESINQSLSDDDTFAPRLFPLLCLYDWVLRSAGLRQCYKGWKGCD